MDRWAAVEAEARGGRFNAVFHPASTEEALRDGPRQFFALTAEVARGQFDPAAQWDAFVQAFWEQVDTGFSLSVDDEDYPGVARAWFDEPGDPDVVVWKPRPEAG